jgi:hypothetical protein
MEEFELTTGTARGEFNWKVITVFEGAIQSCSSRVTQDKHVKLQSENISKKTDLKSNATWHTKILKSIVPQKASQKKSSNMNRHRIGLLNRTVERNERVEKQEGKITRIREERRGNFQKLQQDHKGITKEVLKIWIDIELHYWIQSWSTNEQAAAAGDEITRRREGGILKIATGPVNWEKYELKKYLLSDEGIGSWSGSGADRLIVGTRSEGEGVRGRTRGCCCCLFLGKIVTGKFCAGRRCSQQPTTTSVRHPVFWYTRKPKYRPSVIRFFPSPRAIIFLVRPSSDWTNQIIFDARTIWYYFYIHDK